MAAKNAREDNSLQFAGLIIKDDDVEGLDEKKEIGRGSYGAVYDVRVYGVRCIAKRQHDILVGRGKEERLDPGQRAAAINCFRKECIILCSFRHPNVVQVMGVHCGSDEADISLIMEYMHMDLKHCMETYPDMVLSYKTSILRDVAYGLAYLHSRDIIHRDLNAGNVLLTEFLRAKIADLGVAKLSDREIVLQHTKTCAPGAPDFMPPEATKESPKYSCKLDIFSYGHLGVYLVNQKAPVVADQLVTANDVKKKQMQVAKRRKALDQMSHQLGSFHHPLYSTVVQCLSDTPDKRPTSRDLVKRMEEICGQFSLSYNNSLELLAELQRQENDLKILENDHKVMNQKMLKFAQAQSDSEEAANAKQKQIDVLKEKLAIVEIEARTYKEDFEQERKDREIARGKLACSIENRDFNQQPVSMKRSPRQQLEKELQDCREELEDEKRKRHQREKDLNEVITRLKSINQTLESHLEEKTKLYDELPQQFDKVLEQKVEQVQSVQEKTDAVGKTENEGKKVKEEEDIANKMLKNDEDSKKEEEDNMKGIGDTFLRHQIHQEGSKEKPAVTCKGVADAVQMDVPLASDEQTSHEPSPVIHAKQQGVEVAVQVGEGKINEEQLSDALTTGEIIHAYDVSLRASKEREQELQSQVDALQHQSIIKEQKLSKLEENDSDMQKKMLILRNDYEQQQEVLEKLQQRAVKANLSVEVAVQVDELVGYELETLISRGSSTTDVKEYQEEVKQLQQELEERKKMGRARDVIISNLEREKSQMQKKLNLQKASYQQLLSEKKELQLLGLEDWVIALQAESPTFSEQYQQSLFDMLKAIRLQSGSTVDTAVQADYLAVAPDFLRGVEVSGETVLEVVGDKPQKLKWPGYGFYIEVPEGALPSGVTASVGVKIILNGQFKLPENSQLISAVYWITSSEVFLKEVAVNIQHCAVIRSEEQCSKCKFIIAKCSQEVLPYRFKEKEGLFNAHTQYATIKLRRFSLVGATSPENTELRYIGLKFYKPCTVRRVDFIFVVIRNLEAELNSVTNVYSDYKEDKQMQMIVFENSEITLDLPCDPTKLVVNNNWKLLPLTYPKIAKVDVEQFQAGTRPPACNIELEWTGEGEQQDLSHRVKIIGAEEPNNYFQMRYYPHAMDTPVINHETTRPTQTTSQDTLVAAPTTSDARPSALDTKPDLATLNCFKYKDSQGVLQRIFITDEIAAKWKRFGLALEFTTSDLNNIESKYGTDVEKCINELLTLWLGCSSCQQPITWKTLLEALRDARIEQLADELTAIITKQT